MNKYYCWIFKRKEETHRVIRTNSSFEARQIMANEYDVSFAEAIAQRIWDK